MAGFVQLPLKMAGQILGVPSAAVGRVIGAVGGCALVLLVSGCGIVGSSSSTSGSASGSFTAYQNCLRQHGVNIPTASPSGRPGGFGGGFGGGGNSTFEQARQACASLRPSGGSGGGSGGGFGGGQFAAAIQAFRSCMASRGETIPSARPTAPPTSEPSGADRFLNGLNPSDPKVAAALKACESKLPSFPSRGSSA